ncbi:hypothetical protein F4679DRAFT_584947 [Xylaria curta]|nr:hypothetical protein F4679DRAFT_584947 [Xylaria curta]
MEHWYERNNMSTFAIDIMAARQGSSGIDCQPNYVLLTCNFHKLFDDLALVFVPKPLRVLPSSCVPRTAATTDQSSDQSATDETSLSFLVHFLDHFDLDQDIEQHHNKALRLEDLKTMPRQFLFARFAYALFPRLQNFLSGRGKHKLLTIDVTGDNEYKEQEMTWDQFYKGQKSKERIRKAGEPLAGEVWDPRSEADDDDGDGDGGSGGVPAPTNLPKLSTSVTAVGSSPALSVDTGPALALDESTNVDVVDSGHGSFSEDGDSRRWSGSTLVDSTATYDSETNSEICVTNTKQPPKNLQKR